jgi:glycosyltransferase involved in cell wall biosynthesis
MVSYFIGGDGSKLVVADSGSTDATHSILIEYQKTHPDLEIISEGHKEHGPKLIALYKFAIKSGADYVFQTDSDGQTDPAEFFEFWKERELYEGIFGSRTKRGDGNVKAFVEKSLCILLKLYFGVSIPDANAPFRLMNTAALKKYISKLPEDYNLPNVMVTTFFSFYDERIIFKKITFHPRKRGTNSINVKKIVAIGIKSLEAFRSFKNEM